MNGQSPRGWFVTGTDTEVGKTYVAALLARQFVAAGRRVGVYKPVASGCTASEGRLTSDDALQLWLAAGRPGELDRVCPQCFAAPLSPPRAASAEGRTIDRALLRSGLDAWSAAHEMLIVEGAGGLLSPASDEDSMADLAADFGFPLIVVAANRLGTINHTLLTLEVAARRNLKIAAVVLNDLPGNSGDPSRLTNFADLNSLIGYLALASLDSGGQTLTPAVDWERAPQGALG